MKGFLIYPTYEVIDNKSYVMLFGRLENNQSFLSINEYKPYFYIKKSDLKDALSLQEFEYENNHFKNFISEEVIKVILDIPAEVPKLRKKLEEDGIECYECGKGTRNFELGDLFYCKDIDLGILVKNPIFCPKCNSDISDEKCLVKEHELLMKIVTANLCASSKMKIPKHLKGSNIINENDHEKFSSYCKSKLKFI